MNTQRIGAIFEKDLKEFRKNMMLLMMPVIPIFLAFMYSRMGEGELPIFLLYLIVGATYSAVTTSGMMTMMAEENEKKTLRGLIQSPASLADILIGKSLVVGLFTLISLIISLAILGNNAFLAFQPIIGLILLFLFFLLLGIGIGLFTKSVANTSAYIMPVMFLFGFTPMIEFLNLGEDSIFIKIADYFPIIQMIDMHETNSWTAIGIVTVWVIAAAIFTFVCLKKVSTDN
uniref:ABC transporter permease n=1 Tax=uncultured Allobacillus sp. TaxID=1638025 RepID=UPI00259132A6|nr:ABC transporter permease [uncultured Allobacillus sp.]